MANPSFAGFALLLTTTFSSAVDLPVPDKQDAEFVHRAAIIHLAEIRASADARKRSALSTAERQVAEQIAELHGALNQELSDLALKKNCNMPMMLDAEAQQSADTLAGIEDKQYAVAYLTFVGRNHANAIDVYELEAQNGKDAELKEFCIRSLPHLRAYMATAKTLKDMH